MVRECAILELIIALMGDVLQRPAFKVLALGKKTSGTVPIIVYCTKQGFAHVFTKSCEVPHTMFSLKNVFSLWGVLVKFGNELFG